VVQALGHATIETTMRYAHLSPDARREALGLPEWPLAEPSPASAAEPGSDL
jgi:hypothetical protein